MPPPDDDTAGPDAMATMFVIGSMSLGPYFTAVTLVGDGLLREPDLHVPLL